MPDPHQTGTIAAQRVDIRTLQHDAATRGWADEEARHKRVGDTLDEHLNRLAPLTRPSPSS